MIASPTFVFRDRHLAVILVNLALALLFSFPSETAHSQQNQSMVSPKEVQRAIANAVQKSAKKRGLLIDPRITEQIYANAMVYVGNFCPNPKENCTALFSSNSSLDSLVDQHLADVSALPSGQIKSLAERLAPGEFHKTGWDPNIAVNAGRVEIPPTLQTKPIALRYATEVVPIGSGGTSILMVPGSAELIISVEDKPQRYQVIVERLKATLLNNVASDTSSRPGGVLQPMLEAYCWNAKEPPYTGPFALFNSGRMKLLESEESSRAHAAPFTRQVVLPIQVELGEGVECGKDCEIALASLFADAVATWRSGCLRCEPNAMTMITTLGSAWLDSRIVRRLGSLVTRPTIHLDLEKTEEGERQQTSVSPLGAGGPGVQNYVDISDDKLTRQRICQLDNAAAPWVVGVKNHLCQNQPPQQKETLRPMVVLKKEKTPCGELAVACGLPLDRVEITLSRYRYAIPGSLGQGEIVIGLDNTGEVLEMRRVILHEVGHWFGIPHAQVGGKDKYLDIMSDVYGEGEACVSAYSLRMMANAADNRWQYRIKEGGALMGPRDGGSRR